MAEIHEIGEPVTRDGITTIDETHIFENRPESAATETALMATETARTHSGTGEGVEALHGALRAPREASGREGGIPVEADTEYRIEVWIEQATGLRLAKWQKRLLTADPAELRQAMSRPARRPRLGDLCAAHHALREQRHAKRRAKLRAIHAAYRVKTRRRNRRNR